jgi:hypothetical protein
VAEFNAAYEGLQHTTGAEYDEAFFWGLPHELELCEGAPALDRAEPVGGWGQFTNGTRGPLEPLCTGEETVLTMMIRRRTRSRRLCSWIVRGMLESPFPTQTSFPNRKQRVPIFPRRAAHEDDSSLARTQLPVILAWALTPWKAQGTVPRQGDGAAWKSCEPARRCFRGFDARSPSGRASSRRRLPSLRCVPEAEEPPDVSEAPPLGEVGLGSFCSYNSKVHAQGKSLQRRVPVLDRRRRGPRWRTPGFCGETAGI